MKVVLILLCVIVGSLGRPRHVNHRRIDIDEDCPLCDYVYEDDGFYNFSVYDVVPQDGFTTYFLDLVSQQWLDESFTNKPIWSHHLTIHVPHGQRPHEDAGILYVSGSSSTSSPPNIGSGTIWEMGEICKKHRVVTAVIRQIPNQPLIFTEDPLQRERREDDLIAWTWRQFAEDVNDTEIEADPRILARNPMCKGAIASLDAMTDFVRELDGTGLDRFFMAGRSKRGWTTWIAGAIDDRVVGMSPVVLTCLNMTENFFHYYQSFGGWPYYFWDYWNKGIMSWMDTDEMRELERIVDPYTYRTWMTMPKLVVSGASDEFFLIDDTHYFWDELPGETYYRIYDNTGHSIGNGPHEVEYWEQLGVFSESVFNNPGDDSERPHITWDWFTDEENEEGIITATMSEEPNSASIYWADSVVEDRRDWRLKMLNYSVASAPPNASLPAEVETEIFWEEIPLEPEEDGTFRAVMSFPEPGFYRAFYITFWFDAPEGEEFVFTTEAHVIPEEFPYERCSTPQECFGVLL